MNKLIVKINSKQNSDKQDMIRMQALANAYDKNGILYVIYKEQDLNEKQETSTMLKIQEDSLTLTRTGGVQQQQFFAQGQESVSEYVTPFGNLKMKVKTHRLKMITGVKRVIKINYALYINDSWQSDNELVIKLEPAN
ncbi:DUF1934 domain-containing protein [uncultured Megamonas sp.]|uniref:DUF1934 domain-containing protein n=1 Tax=uncultured Megamonas sp. TaxID=286140 RepID=UPI0025E2634A|nr:DUF1934 domain-containing protein [uncultured Megamonas sp.]